MGYFSGNIVARGTMAKRMLLTNSSIVDTTIDMNLKTITSVHDPIDPQDAATRYYVDASVQKVESEFQSFFTGVVVSLNGTDFVEIAHIRPGSYIVTVTPFQDGFPTATFSISKLGAYSTGHVSRITAGIDPKTRETLDLQWPQGGVLLLRKTGPGFDGDYLVDLNMKNMSMLSGPPVLPSDQASKAYVDKVVQETLDVKFGGVNVNLSGMNFASVINLATGSYMITVTPHCDGAPTSTFSVSKNSVDNDAIIKEVTGCAGLQSPEKLEMSWPPNSMLLLRKTGPGYDGLYLVDFNLKNFSNAPPPPVPIPDDGPGGSNCDDRNLSKGINVTLEGTNTAIVMVLAPGSYLLTISPKIQNGPTATFSVSKSLQGMEPSVFRITGTKGADNNTDINILWPPNEALSVYKTGLNFDGIYTVETLARNITTVSISDGGNDDASGCTGTGVLKYEFFLSNQNETAVARIEAGTYFAFVSSYEQGLYTATFSLMKLKGYVGVGSTVPMTINKGTEAMADVDTRDFALILRWGEDDRLYASKTTSEHDGLFLLKLM